MLEKGSKARIISNSKSRPSVNGQTATIIDSYLRGGRMSCNEIYRTSLGMFWRDELTTEA